MQLVLLESLQEQNRLPGAPPPPCFLGQAAVNHNDWHLACFTRAFGGPSERTAGSSLH